MMAVNGINVKVLFEAMKGGKGGRSSGGGRRGEGRTGPDSRIGKAPKLHSCSPTMTPGNSTLCLLRLNRELERMSIPDRSPTLFDPADFPPSPALTLVESSRALRLSCFQPLSVIGTGSSGVVFLAKHKPTGRQVALKMVKKHMERNVWVRGEQEALRRVVGETRLAQMLGSFEDKGYFVLVMEYYPGGSVATELKGNKRLAPDRVQFVTASLILTLCNLHACRIMHRDIKPENILFSSRGHVVLADLGLSVVFDNDNHEWGGSDSDRTTGDSGTFAFMAPEMLDGQEYSYEVDFWAVGVLLYLMLVGRIPFGRNARSVDEFAHCIASEPLSFESADHVDSITRDFLRKLLNRNPEERLADIEWIKVHPYFENIDWDALASPDFEPPPCVQEERTVMSPRRRVLQELYGSDPFEFEDYDNMKRMALGMGWQDKDKYADNESEYPDFYYISPELSCPGHPHYDGEGKLEHIHKEAWWNWNAEKDFRFGEDAGEEKGVTKSEKRKGWWMKHLWGKKSRRNGQKACA